MLTLENTVASFTPFRAQNEATSASLPGCSPKIISRNKCLATEDQTIKFLPYLLTSKLKAIKVEMNYLNFEWTNTCTVSSNLVAGENGNFHSFVFQRSDS